jgi:hypothetical protein
MSSIFFAQFPVDEFGFDGVKFIDLTWLRIFGEKTGGVWQNDLGAVTYESEDSVLILCASQSDIQKRGHLLQAKFQSKTRRVIGHVKGYDSMKLSWGDIKIQNQLPFYVNGALHFMPLTTPWTLTLSAFEWKE